MKTSAQIKLEMGIDQNLLKNLNLKGARMISLICYLTNQLTCIELEVQRAQSCEKI